MILFIFQATKIDKLFPNAEKIAYLCSNIFRITEDLKARIKEYYGTKGNAAELGTENIRKLLVQYAVPAIIAMTASSLYNMVDSIFIGHGVGPLAISGLAITFPLMNLAAAFGSLVGVGASTLISVKLGQKDYLTAQQILGNVVSLNVIIGVIFTVITLLFLDPILYFFGASEATIPYARDYMITILLGNVVTHMYRLNSVLRSAGHPQKAMIATILTVVINTILDPLFIYTFDMGIREPPSQPFWHRSFHSAGSSASSATRKSFCTFKKAFTVSKAYW